MTEHWDASGSAVRKAPAPSLILVIPVLSDTHTAGNRMALMARAEDAAAIMDLPLYIMGGSEGVRVMEHP